MALVEVANCIEFAQITEGMLTLQADRTLEDCVEEILGRVSAQIARRVGAYDETTDPGLEADMQQVELLLVRAELRSMAATVVASYQHEPLPSDYRVDVGELRRLAQDDREQAEAILARHDTSEPRDFLGVMASGGVDDVERKPGVLGMLY